MNEEAVGSALSKQGAAGSSPATSTKPLHSERLREFPFGAHLRTYMNCARKHSNEPLCTITTARKSLRLENAFRQSETKTRCSAAQKCRYARFNKSFKNFSRREINGQ